MKKLSDFLVRRKAKERVTDWRPQVGDLVSFKHIGVMFEGVIERPYRLRSNPLNTIWVVNSGERTWYWLTRELKLKLRKQ